MQARGKEKEKTNYAYAARMLLVEENEEGQAFGRPSLTANVKCEILMKLYSRRFEIPLMIFHTEQTLSVTQHFHAWLVIGHILRVCMRACMLATQPN